MDEGGSRKSEVWSDLCSGEESNYITKVLRRAPGFLSAGMVLREEIIIVWSRMTVFLGDILAEVRWRLNARISGGGYSVYQLVFGYVPVDPHGWGVSKDEDLLFAQDTSRPGQFARQ